MSNKILWTGDLRPNKRWIVVKFADGSTSKYNADDVTMVWYEDEYD